MELTSAITLSSLRELNIQLVWTTLQVKQSRLNTVLCMGY